MATWNRVYAAIWANQDFRSWSEDARTAALYVLTCEQRTTEGLFRLPLVFAAYELQWPQGRVDEAFAELEAAEFVALDRGADLVWLINALKWNPPRGDKQLKGAVAALMKVPKSPLRARYIDRCRIDHPELAEALDSAGFIPLRRGIEGVSKGYPPHSHSHTHSHAHSQPLPRSVSQKGDQPNPTAVESGGGDGYDHPRQPLDLATATWHSAMDQLGYRKRRDPDPGQVRTIELALDQGHHPDALLALCIRALDADRPVEYLIGAWRKMGQGPPLSVSAGTTESEISRPEIPEFEPDDTPMTDPTVAANHLAAARAQIPE